MRANKITLANWQDPANTAWSYRHVRELMPTARIARAERSAPLPAGSAGAPLAVERLLADDSTDGLLVAHDGEVVLEEYRRGMGPDDVHLLQSVSKSITGTVAGILAQRGTLAVTAPVVDYVPELADSSFAGAPVRDLLDMRTGTRFDETYEDPASDVRALEAQYGWVPGPRGAPDILAYLTELGNDRPHGGRFEYRSVLTDVLGLVLERAAGVPFAEVVGRELWSRIGAETDAYVTLDADGFAAADGGVCVTLRDLTRLGLAVLAGLSGGESPLPSAWLIDTLHGGADSAAAFAEEPYEEGMAGGHYRNQWWVPAGRSTLLARGIHGQSLFVDLNSRTVIAVLSTWPSPWDDRRAADMLSAFAASAATLGGAQGGA